MKHRSKYGRARWGPALTALVGFALLLPAGAQAQYTAPPPEPGFEYIFDGTATGSDASFDKWLSANGATAVTLDPALGAMNPNTSGFGMKWYPVRALGDVVVRLEYMWPTDPAATPNGGVMVRFPEPRYVGTTAEVLAQKPTGYNYDLCPGAAPVVLRPAAARAVDDVRRGRAATCRSRRRSATRAPTAPATAPTTSPTSRAPSRRVTASNANNHQHWLSVFCGHEIQINEALQISGSDAVKTGSMYGFANINAKQARNDERQTRGVWHTMEIRMVGQQYTVLVDGNVINQFDNGVPRMLARRRPADPGAPVPARLLRPADARRDRPDLLPRDPRQGARRRHHPAQRRAAGSRAARAASARR